MVVVFLSSFAGVTMQSYDDYSVHAHVLAVHTISCMCMVQAPIYSEVEVGLLLHSFFQVTSFQTKKIKEATGLVFEPCEYTMGAWLVE
jgi:hypothetical protein